MMAATRGIFPDIRGVASTWCFDKPVVNGSEYVGLDAFIKHERNTR
jgi:hypothetical protein